MQKLFKRLENVFMTKYPKDNPAIINEKIGMIVSKVEEALKPFDIHGIDNWNITPFSRIDCCKRLHKVDQEELCGIYLLIKDVILTLKVILVFKFTEWWWWHPDENVRRSLNEQYLQKPENIREINIIIKQILINKDLKPITVNGKNLKLSYFNTRQPDIIEFDSMEAAIKYESKITELKRGSRNRNKGH